ncbi:integral membrane protein, Mpv17/PMP22 family [Aspergillus niger]|uniref:Integral membrane protein, Mpv17/PMP22 family n=1 Tax=Aspergillus niger TaxID=5061 RepID=A0A100IHV7_ASPNG|nr:integral membrane protein, Mpv17/PMP22 family [Aspergillus niger]
MAAAMRLAAKFNSYYAEKPVLTTMVTNAILGGIADTVAQLITAFKARGGRRPSDGNDLISIEIHDLDKEKPPALGELGHARHLAPAFDFERLTRFMSYGFFMAPVQFHWFGFLSRTFPLTKRNPSIPALKRVCVDQLMFAPFGLACFFSFMTVTEGGGRRALTRKFQDVYLPTLKANFVLWPAVQILNFRVVPIQFQIPFVSSVGIAWTAYLSLTNSSEDESTPGRSRSSHRSHDPRLRGSERGITGIMFTPEAPDPSVIDSRSLTSVPHQPEAPAILLLSPAAPPPAHNHHFYPAAEPNEVVASSA